MSDSAIDQHQSYDPRFFARIAEIEDHHFWFGARNRVIVAAIRSVITGLPAGYRVLEVGCGTGVVLRQLTEACQGGEVMGMDLYPEAVAFASGRAGCRVLVGDILDPPCFGEFDMVGVFDVLEHLPNDRQILEGLSRMLKPGGTLILTVPAHMSLWSYFDIAACHRRRYERAGLIHKLEESGFRVEYATEFMVSLYPLIWLIRRIRGDHTTMKRELAAAKADSELRIIPVINGLLKSVLALEAFAVARRWRLPLGTSLLAVARKIESVNETIHSVPEGRRARQSPEGQLPQK